MIEFIDQDSGLPLFLSPNLEVLSIRRAYDGKGTNIHIKMPNGGFGYGNNSYVATYTVEESPRIVARRFGKTV